VKLNNDIDVFEMRKILHKILSADVGWDIERRQFLVSEDYLIDVATSLVKGLKKRGVK
jgi:hypothetical protein